MEAHSSQGVSWIDDAPMPPEDQYAMQMLPVMHDPDQRFDNRYTSSPPDILSPYSVASNHSSSSHGSMSSGMSGYHTAAGSPDSFYGSPYTSPPQFDIKQEDFSDFQEDLNSYVTSTVEIQDEWPAAEMQNDWSTVEIQDDWFDYEEAEDEEVEGEVHVIPEDEQFDSRVFIYQEGWIEAIFYENKEPEPRGVFRTKKPNFWIDGMTNTENLEKEHAPDRFSLGTYVAQSNIIKLVRQIGKGVQIYKDDQGNVFLENPSKSPVYVLCPGYSERVGDSYGKVYKLTNKVNSEDLTQMLVFDSGLFEKRLENATIASDYDKLSMYCYLRISFLKGFGNEYPMRPDIQGCPIWVEVKMTAALHSIDDKYYQTFPLERDP